MKKFILLVLPLFLLACSTEEDDQLKAYYELLPIQRCQMPYYFHSGETYDISMTFRLPTSCHDYKGVYVQQDGNTMRVAIQSIVYGRADCQPLNYDALLPEAHEPQIEDYTFRAGAAGTVYTFKIWTGKNEQGEDTYYDVTVPVQ